MGRGPGVDALVSVQPGDHDGVLAAGAEVGPHDSDRPPLMIHRPPLTLATRRVGDSEVQIKGMDAAGDGARARLAVRSPRCPSPSPPCYGERARRELGAVVPCGGGRSGKRLPSRPPT